MKRLFHTVLLITIFSCITRAFGFLFRIFLSRELGSVVLGEYQIALSVFGVLCTLIASGLPVILSREISTNNANGNQAKSASFVGSGLLLSLIISVASCSIILIFPNLLKNVLTSENSVTVLNLLLPGVVATSIYATFRGALWGTKHLVWLEITELFEQVVRIVLCIILFSTLSTNHPKSELAAFSLSLSCILSCILVSIVFFINGGKIKSPKGSFKQLTLSSTPITAIRSASSLVTSLIAIIIPLRLVACGMTQTEALSIFGILSGMTLPLLTIPGTLIGSLAVTLIPELSSSTTKIDKLTDEKKRATIKSQINNSLGISIVLSFLFVPAYFSLGTPICSVLFNNIEAGQFLIQSCMLMVPMGICQISNSMLNAIGLEIKSLLNYAAGAICLIASIFFLPQYIGISALILGMFVMYILTCLLNLFMLSKRKLLSKKHIKTLLFMVLICIFSASTTKLIFNICQTFTSEFFSVTFSGIFSVFIFLTLTLFFNIAGFSSFVFKGRKNAKLHNEKSNNAEKTEQIV